jgi:NADPH:quinone reductase-like Zn-dependent oxidoreductase
MKGLYHNFDLFKIQPGVSPGWEGAGVVVKSGGGMIANRAVG